MKELPRPIRLLPILKSQMAKTQLTEQLDDIHELGFTLANISYSNIVYNSKLKRYQFINYGRIFHATNSAFPPMEYMVNDEEIPRQSEDRIELAVALATIDGMHGIDCTKTMAACMYSVMRRLRQELEQHLPLDDD